MSKSTDQVLIVKLGAIGDVVMSLPMVYELRRRRPECRITWVIGKGIKGIVEAVSEIDDVIVVDDGKLLGSSLVHRGLEFFRVFFKLVGKKFDLVLVGHSNRGYRALVSGVRSSEKRSFGTRPEGHALPALARHHSSEYVRLATGINGSLLPEPRAYKLFSYTGHGKRQIGIAPGGAKNLKRDTPHRRWPLQSYVELSRELIAAGFEVVLFGGPTDSWVLESFGSLPVKSLIGKLSLLETAQRMSEMSCIVSHDSGPAHLASLSDVPLVVLFGPTQPENFAPLGESVRVLRTATRLPCQPCYDGLECSPCSDYKCMTSIPVADVLRAAQEVGL